MDNKQKKVEVKIITFINDPGNGYFDFSKLEEMAFNEMTITELNVDDDCYLSRNNQNNEIKKYLQNQECDIENGDILFRIRKSINNNNFEIINPVRINMKKNEKNINNLKHYNLWYVIKSDGNFCGNNNEDYILNENDIIKLGNNQYEIITLNINITKDEEDKKNLKLIKKYNISNINKEVGSIFNINLNSNQYINQNNNEMQNSNTSQINEDILKKTKCRICNNDSNLNIYDNPLLQLCSCQDYIHYQCLKDIINAKENIIKHENKKVIRYKYNKFYCDKCKMQYPLRFKIFETIYELIDLTIDKETDFIILESLYREDKAKVVYIIKFDKTLNNEEINIGRQDNLNDFIDTEGSISRFHAVLKKDKRGNIIIDDKKSTYGTCVLIKENIKLREEKIHFQIGRSYISACLNGNENKN